MTAHDALWLAQATNAEILELIAELEAELAAERQGRELLPEPCPTCGDILHSGPCRAFDPENPEDWDELPKVVRERYEKAEFLLSQVVEARRKAEAEVERLRSALESIRAGRRTDSRSIELARLALSRGGGRETEPLSAKPREMEPGHDGMRPRRERRTAANPAPSGVSLSPAAKTPCPAHDKFYHRCPECLRLAAARKETSR